VLVHRPCGNASCRECPSDGCKARPAVPAAPRDRPTTASWRGRRRNPQRPQPDLSLDPPMNCLLAGGRNEETTLPAMRVTESAALGYGHTKIAGKQVLRKGLSPLVTTISTAESAPVIAGMRLRAGRAGSGKGAGRMIAAAINTARAAGVGGPILVRGDSAYGTRAVISACVRHGAEFSLVMTRNAAVQRAIAAISEESWMPRSPRSPTPPSPALPRRSPPAWSCAGSRTPTTSRRCSPYGGTTRF
jgi:hypothetical protein